LPIPTRSSGICLRISDFRVLTFAVLACGLFASPTLSTPRPVTAPTLAPAAPLCTDPQPPLVTGFEVRQVLPLPEPPARVPFRDPAFGTCLVRVTDRKADLSPDDPSEGLKNEYSRVQSFNADSSRILVGGINATWYLYDAQTLLPLGQLPLEVDPRWDTYYPKLICYSAQTRLISCNTQIGEQYEED